MPTELRRSAAQHIVDEASSDALDFVAELAEPLAEYMLDDYERQDSPDPEALARRSSKVS